MTVDDLEKCISTCLELARSRGLVEISTGTRDYYWQIGWPEWTDMAKDPAVQVGSLDDDISELRKLLNDPESATSVDLDRAASILRLLADNLVD